MYYLKQGNTISNRSPEKMLLDATQWENYFGPSVEVFLNLPAKMYIESIGLYEILSEDRVDQLCVYMCEQLPLNATQLARLHGPKTEMECAEWHEIEDFTIEDAISVAKDSLSGCDRIWFVSLVLEQYNIDLEPIAEYAKKNFPLKVL